MTGTRTTHGRGWTAMSWTEPAWRRTVGRSSCVSTASNQCESSHHARLRRDGNLVRPFSVDGMLVVATIVMVDDKRRAHRVRPMARLAFTAGVIASIAANIAAAHPSIGARIIDAWPALALLLVVEMLARPPAAADTQTQ